MARRKRYVAWKATSRKTGHLMGSGGFYVEANDIYEAEGLALAEIKRNPPVWSTEGVDYEVKCTDA